MTKIEYGSNKVNCPIGNEQEWLMCLVRFTRRFWFESRVPNYGWCIHSGC